MSNSLGLFTRNGVFYLRYIIPKRHRRHFNGRSRIVRSLHTTSRSEARTQALLLRARLTDTTQAEMLTAPQISPPNAVRNTFSLRTLFAEWQQTKNPSKDTQRACELAVDAFLDLQKLNDIAVSDITRQQGQRFATHLIQQCASKKTAHGKLTWVKSLLNFAVDSLEALPRNQWAGINIQYSKTTKRRTWSDNEIATLLNAATSHATSRTMQKQSGGAAAYWLPILAMYTGARLSELAQLQPCNVLKEPDGYWLNITDAGEGQQIKSVHSSRKIPVHPTLIDVGFIEYVEALEGKQTLWPDLPKRTNKAGGYFSNWFGRHLKSLDLQGVDFHSFRHTFRTKLVLVGAPEAVIDVLMGHSPANNVGKSRYTHVSSVLRDQLSKITYEIR